MRGFVFSIVFTLKLLVLFALTTFVAITASLGLISSRICSQGLVLIFIGLTGRQTHKHTRSGGYRVMGSELVLQGLVCVTSVYHEDPHAEGKPLYINTG